MTDGGWEMKEIPGSEFSMKADLVLLAMGFTHVMHSGLVEKLRLNLDKAGNIVVDADAQSSEPGIFAAGDSVAGASLVVRAIASGRAVANSINRWLLQR
jgi:glutamate synthase (NADPH/NADH) small chain